MNFIRAFFLPFLILNAHGVFPQPQVGRAKVRPEKVYRVVLDPGHGGLNIRPGSVYGDKYDLLSLEYLDDFRSGAYYDGVWENEEAYFIARMVQDHLFLTQSQQGKKIFRSILQKYARHSIHKVGTIEAFLSRENSYPALYFDIREDINAPYRIYDYRDIRTNRPSKGRISKINSFKPHLVVSIHLTRGEKNKIGGLNAVITPGYSTYRLAIDYVKNPGKRSRIKKRFQDSHYQDWFLTKGRSRFESFLLDSWIYFTGYWCKKHGLSYLQDNFRGYRHNMVTWRYRDAGSWYLQARKHRDRTRYSRSLKTISLKGAFWQREKSKPEAWRREKGFESYGGDNLYASHEILRYVRKGLLANQIESKDALPLLLEPYISTWSVPTFVNAISAYLEIGYLDIEADYQRILEYKNVYAEAIAVGIYSLFFSIRQDKKNKENDLPLGNSIDFKKYENYRGLNYFKEVIR